MKIIFLSAGHSKTQPGAVANGEREADIVLSLRDAVAEELRGRGTKVLTDGKAGENLPLPNAIRLAKTVSGHRVEFHLNAGPPLATGVEALSLPTHKVVAQRLADAVARTLDIPKRGEGGWKSDSSGQHSRLGFCREGNGILLEVFFLTNKKDLEAYGKHSQSLVRALADELIVE